MCRGKLKIADQKKDLDSRFHALHNSSLMKPKFSNIEIVSEF
jgi:hypothetical protein